MLATILVLEGKKMRKKGRGIEKERWKENEKKMRKNSEKRETRKWFYVSHSMCDEKLYCGRVS